MSAFLDRRDRLTDAVNLYLVNMCKFRLLYVVRGLIVMAWSSQRVVVCLGFVVDLISV